MLCYKKVCFLLLFDIVTSSIASLSKRASLTSKEEYYNKIINDFVDFLGNHSEEGLFNETYNEKYKDCIQNNTTENQTNQTNQIYDLIEFSGKNLGDPGLENDCLLNGNNTFFLLSYSLNLSEYLKNKPQEKEALRFLDNNNFTTGICAFKRCLPFLEDFFNSTKNSKFETFLKENYYLTYFTTYNVDLAKEKLKKESSGSKLAFMIFWWASTILFFFRLLCSFIKVIFFSTFKVHVPSEEPEQSPDKKKKNKKRNSLRKEKTSKTNDDIFLFSNDSISQREFISDKKPYSQRFLNFWDLSYNLKYLSSIKNNYYNDEGLEIFSFFKFITMLLLTYNHCMYISIMLPGADYFNQNFYTSFFFFLMKFPAFSSASWIILEAAITSYKLLSFIKKELNSSNNNGISFKMFAIFFMRSIPKMFLTVLVYFFLHIYLKYIQLLMNSGGSSFLYYMNTMQENRFCYTNPFYIFIPFYVEYQDHTMSFSNCFRFANITFNQLYCFILLLLVIYICFKAKSRILDFCILGGLVLNICLIILSCEIFNNDIKFGDYTISEIQGHAVTEKRTHLFINYYLIGTFVGLCYFYYGDMISQNALSLNQDYYPFGFCYSIVSFLDPLKNWIKTVIAIVAFLLMILLSSVYSIARAINNIGVAETVIIVKFNGFLKFIYYYEKDIFSLLFAIILLVAMVYPKDTAFYNLLKPNIFVIFNRIGFAFFTSSNALIYLANSMFSIKLKLTYQNLFFMNIGLFLIVTLISIILTILYELPLRILIIKLDNIIRHKEKQVSKIDQINEEKVFPLLDKKIV